MGRWWSAIVLTVTAVMVVVLSLVSGDASAKAKSSEATLDLGLTCAGNQVTFFNNYSYPVWLGEAVQNGSQVISPNTQNDWKIASLSSTQMCLPSGWSGNFWARTGCQFDTLYSSDPNYKTCSSDSDCSSGHICWGGQCLISGCSTNADCISQLNNNSSAQCQTIPTPTPTGSPVPTSSPTPLSVCVIPTVCETGDCGGASQCYGTWDGVPLNVGGAPPVSLFEPTSNSATNVNYDVSLVSGYNTSISVVPSVSASGANCYAPACVADLNTVCPANLQVLASPTASPSTSIPCGGGYCASGVCQTNMCVIGCNQPGTQCATSPNPGLMCTSPVALPSGAPSPSWVPDGSAYEDMYSAKNLSGLVDSNPSDLGISMASGLQGTALCWSDVECPSGQSCDLGVLPANYPASIGVCSGQSSATNCQTSADVGNQCGNYSSDGFPNALGYSCVALTNKDSGQVACVPPATAGLGSGPNSAESQADLYAGAAGLSNPEWIAAAMQAGNGAEPYFETFSNACPREYAWQYDDYAGGLDCNSNGAENVNFTVTFGPTASASPTPTPTATASGSPTPTETPTDTPTATPTASVSPTPTVLQATPRRHSFGRVLASDKSKPHTFRLKNVGQADAQIGQLVAPTDFSITNDNCSNTTIHPRNDCPFEVSFSPQSVTGGTESQTLSIPYNDGGNPLNVTFEGEGLAVMLRAPKARSFPATASGSTSTEKKITIVNPTGVPVTLDAGSISPDFKIASGDCAGMTLVKGGTQDRCSVMITFTPANSTPPGPVSGEKLSYGYSYGTGLSGSVDVTLKGRVK